MKKISIHILIFYIITIMPISTLIQGLPYLNSVNQVLVGMLLILLCLNAIRTHELSEIIIILFSIIVYLYSYYINKGISRYNFNDIFYFPMWVLFLMYLTKNYDIIKRLCIEKKKYLIKVIFFWNIIVLISMFIPSSYSNSWGGGFYFSSFSRGAHRFAGCCIYIIILVSIMYEVIKDKQILLYSILPILGVCLCGARTYLGILAGFLISLWYKKCKSKTKFFVTVIPLSIIFIALVMISPMADKFIATQNVGNFDAIGSFTNGRTVFWEADIKAFNDSNFINRLLGNGFDFVYIVNTQAIYTPIWAHNDFINILLNFGYVGLFVYIYVYLKFSIKFLRKEKIRGVLKIGYYFIWFFNAMFNMVYTYTCSTLFIPFLLIMLSNKNNLEKGEESEKINTIDFRENSMC